jgi:hypothetical protein
MLTMTGSAHCFNHPEIKWRSVVTDHFFIHYYDRTEPAVYAAWKIVEQAYASLSDLYDFEERGKINIALADFDDYSNGFASWTNGSIMIWIIDEYFDLRGNNTWLRNVITHELSHIVTLEKRPGIQLIDWTFSVDYASPNASIALTDPLLTNLMWPSWFAEGIAQREAQRAGNDGWDSRRDMLLRDAIFFSKPLSLSEMGHFNHNSLGNELVYNQGFSFVTFLENKLGVNKLREILNDGRRTTLFAEHFYDFFYEHTGISIEKCYEEWIDSVKNADKRLIPQTQTSVTVVWDRGFLNSMPKLSRDHALIGWLTNEGDDFSRTDLLIAPRSAPERSIRIPWAKQSWDFSPDGKKVYYIKSHTPNQNGSYINDLFMYGLDDNRETRIVKNARAYDIAIAPDNSCMAWIRYGDGAFSIVKSALDGRDPSIVIQGAIGEPLWRLSFDPNDPSQLATTRVIEGKTQLCVIDMEKKTITPITGADAQEESPNWANDGRIYYSADYDGISNIYSVNPDGSDCLQHTSTSGGLFSPFVSDDSTFLGTEYRNKGFRVVFGSMMRDSSFTPPDSSPLSFKPLPKPKGKVTIRSAPYEPRLLRREWELQTALSVMDPYGKIGDIGTPGASSKFTDSLSFAVSAAIVSNRSDALGKRTSWMGLQIGLQGRGKSRDTTLRNNETYLCAPVSGISRQTPLQFFSPQRLWESPLWSPGTRNMLLSNRRFDENGRGHFSMTRSASSDSVDKRTIVPLIIPGIGWQSMEHSLTLGLNLQAALVNIIVPSMIVANGEAQWQILRDWYATFSPQLQFYPAYLLAGQLLGVTSFPVTVSWRSSGYLNTDLAYNYRGLTLVQCAVAPSFFPIGQDVLLPDGRDSTIYRGGSSTALEIQCNHGFPLRYYSSIVVAAIASETYYSESIGDPLDSLKGSSDLYTSAGLSAQFIFPVARQINRGTHYADALYGSLFYNVMVYSNRDWEAQALSRALSFPSYNSQNFFVEHSVGAAMTFGVTKAYVFSQMNTLSIKWNVWRKRLQVNLSAGL